MTSTDLFDFHLPPELIAQRPAAARDLSRLLTLDRKTGAIGHRSFSDFPAFLGAGDTLVINNTKVIPARLWASRATGGKVEILLIRNLGGGAFKAMVRGLARVKIGESLTVGGETAQVAAKLDDGTAIVKFGSESLAQGIISALGETPLPPYIHRPEGKPDEDDLQRYQTVFAKVPGSCAAPTAGLHFTTAILGAIANRGVNIAEVTLHVGPGTFRPLSAANIEDHVMDSEYFEITGQTADLVNSTRSKGGRIIAVGSTAARAMESSARDVGSLRAGSGETRLFITPGFEFRIVDAILTNFHLPRSTLLVMMAAFAGRERVLAAYREAVEKKYRFFSYGDAILIT
jgi:S-adenosylmethionine:tRNA ribosyltransferase-isomerase